MDGRLIIFLRETTMLDATRTARLFLCLAAVAALGCGGDQPSKKRVGPLKDWIVGDWVRQDDGIAWNFNAGGEFITQGRLPVGGAYSVEEPDKVTIVVTGSNAITSSMQLGFPIVGNETMKGTFVVKDDEMRPSGPNAKTTVVFKKQ
jgi:hypothetical protein